MTTFDKGEFPSLLGGESEIAQYYQEATERIKAGETVWMQRNFDSESGRILDLYGNRQHLGFVEQDFTDMTCDVYLIDRDGSTLEPKIITSERLELEEAARVLAEAAQIS